MVKGQVVELKLDAAAHGGQALGRHEGKVIFVDGVLPGEVARVRIVDDRKRWARAALLEVIQPSPDRVDPPCPYYGSCGGCHWQHAAYASQLTYKRQIVVEQLRRLGHLEDLPVRPVMGMEEPWFYRNHAQFRPDRSGQLGFQASRSHDVVPIDQCLLLHPLLDELYVALDLDWPELRQLSLRAGIHTGEQMCIFEIGDDAFPELEVDLPVSCVLRLSDGRDVALIGRDAYHEELRGRLFRISAASFFQVNTEQAEVLLDVVAELLDPQPKDTLLDVFCGVGTLGLSVCDQVGRVIGLEEHPAAVADAVANAQGNERVTLLHGEARATIAQVQAEITKVILDPPRQGCHPQLISALLSARPQRIVYVSCDPTTLARDAALLVEGGYAPLAVQPIDMFPQTYHIETVSLWRPAEAHR